MSRIADNINDAYFDKLGLEFGMQTRERLHWVCSRASGMSVLDIGCSGGIADILMAREGKTVFGVDIDAESIEKAKLLLAGEDKSTQERVFFLCTDIMQTDLGDERFDTVILAEVLEHLLYPEAMLQRVSGLVKGGGTVIITTPFGINPWQDHKNTFYLTDLIELCARHFSVSEARILDRNSAVIAMNAPGGMPPADSLLLKELESGIRAKEEYLYHSIFRQEDRLAATSGKLAEIDGRLRHFISENMKLQKNNAVLRQQLELVYKSARFKAGSRLVEVARNPLKVFLIPYWAVKIIYKRFGGKLRAPKHETNKNYPITFPDFKVATVIDEISYSCFKYECDLYRVSRRNFRKEVDDFKPDVLFVESAWHGNNGEWEGVVSAAGSDLSDLVQHCKSNGIPTVFWCKEDPPQYETFKKAAALFDWVFTTDINCVPKYKADLGHENVDVLMFAVQPKLQNPLRPKEGKLNRVCFAGIYYKTKFFERQKLFEELADAAMAFGLDIYDRFSYVKNTDAYKYPDKYKAVLKPYVPYDDLVELYKRYDVVINLNSVSDSDTMFSRRVFDAVACGVCVLSTPSSGMEKLFGDIVGVARSRQEAEEFLMKVLSDSLYRDKLTARGYTRIVEQHTYAGRLASVARKIGRTLPDSNIRKVSAVVVTMRPKYIDRVFDNFVKQTWPHKELIIVVNSDEADIEQYNMRVAQYPGEDIRVFRQAKDVPLGACLNFAFDKAKYDTLLKMDDDDYFGRDYLKDELVFFEFTDAGVIGKNTFYVYFEGSGRIALRYPGKENIFTDIVAGSAMIFKREVYNKVRFDDTLNVSEIAAFLKLAGKKGFKVFSTHRFNHAVVRRELQGHTWREPEEEYMRKCELVEENVGPERLAEIVDL